MPLKLFDLYAKFLIRVMIVLMFILLGAVALTVAGRYIPFIPRFLWTLEVTNISLIWMVFVGSVVGLRESRHFYIDIFAKGVPRWFEVFLKILNYVVTLTVIYVFVRYGYRFFTEWGLIQTSELTGINLGFLYASVPFAGVSWLIFMIERFYHDFIKKDLSEEHHMSDSYQVHHEDEDTTRGETDK
ncbi:TRAP transporter small permease subunit [Marispirochaeta aestuarii]|uniref:TRAP transporter small permease n=1 Tax=Marispirochaeta aestuarii TaxID=1963862 RepID=UPI0029C927F9|nr:TRAP transporter small permease subunit [Marispirochaeta aestuarii]